MTSLLNEPDVVFDALTVGGGKHHITEFISGFEIPRVEKLPPLRLTLWDTFGVDDTNWPEDSFRDFLKGYLKVYSIADPVEIPRTIYGLLHKIIFAPSPLDRMHQINFFMKSSTLKNGNDSIKLISLRKAAGKEGFNPFLFITFEGNMTDEERTTVKNERVPKEFGQSIYFAPFSLMRNPKTDREALEIIRLIQISSENQLSKIYPVPNGFERMKELLLFISFTTILSVLGLYVLNKILNFFFDSEPKRQRIVPPVLVQAQDEDHDPHSPIIGEPPSHRNSPNNQRAHQDEPSQKIVENPNANYRYNNSNELEINNRRLSDSVSDEEHETLDKYEHINELDYPKMDPPPLYSSKIEK